MVQLSHPYMTTGKTVALTIWAFVDKVMSPLFNILLRFVTASLHGYSLVVVKGLVYASEALSHALQGHQGQTGDSGEFGENTGHWRREW